MTYAIAELMRLGLSHAEAVQLAAFLARKQFVAFLARKGQA